MLAKSTQRSPLGRFKKKKYKWLKRMWKKYSHSLVSKEMQIVRHSASDPSLDIPDWLGSPRLGRWAQPCGYSEVQGRQLKRQDATPAAPSTPHLHPLACTCRMSFRL